MTSTATRSAGSVVGGLKDRVLMRIENRALKPDAYRLLIANSEMVRRDVVRLVTPGTLTEDELLDALRQGQLAFFVAQFFIQYVKSFAEFVF